MNPFTKIAETDPEGARILALAFVVSHSQGDDRDVHAALRMAQRLDFRDRRPSAYLSGALFSPWFDDDGESTSHAVTHIRDNLAHPYIDSLEQEVAR